MSENNNSYRIIGKIILKALLKNETPLLIGKGVGDTADIGVVRLPDGKPYIPASSFAGALKHFMLFHGLSVENTHFWGRSGKTEENPLQSHLRIDDLIPQKVGDQDIVVRDGVKIDPKTGTAEDKKKYDYEVVEPGLVFPLRIELTIRQGMKDDDALEFIGKIEAALTHPEFRIGAFANTGFGKLTCSGFQAYHFRFPNDADAWFNYIDSGELTIAPFESNGSQIWDKKGYFSIEAIFRLKTSLIVGGYGINSDEPDKSQLKSRNRFVLPGKSIRGGIRHRAIKILSTLDTPNTDERLNDLFGFMNEDTQTQKKGRLRVEEYIFSESEVQAMVQNRIRIDRFTGGVIDNALFNTEPIWTTEAETIRLKLTILHGADTEDKKLLLNILKDLWLEDLAIGGEKNIGRGILIGQSATILDSDNVVAEFERNGSGGLSFTQGSAVAINNLILPVEV